MSNTKGEGGRKIRFRIFTRKAIHYTFRSLFEFFFLAALPSGRAGGNMASKKGSATLMNHYRISLRICDSFLTTDAIRLS